MQILSEDQREALLKSLNSAPDEVLLAAVREMKDHRVSIQKGFDDLKGFIGQPLAPVIAPTLSKYVLPAALVMSPPVEAVVESQLTLPEVEPPKANVAPPGEAAYKCGGKTKDEILAMCKFPRTLAQVNSGLGRGKGRMEDTQKLLKRLWDQSLLKYDGETYYNVG